YHGTGERKATMKRKLLLKQLLLPFLLSRLTVSDAQAPSITMVTPKTGSVNGATRLTIAGQGFADANQFNFGAGNDNLGNSVQLVSDTRSIPCDVEKDSSHKTQIICYTRPMPEDNYVVQVSVDGVLIPDSNICYGSFYSYWCSFYPRSYRTPMISSITPLTGLPGTLVTIRGLIFTDVYGSNTDKSSNGLDARIVRVYVGGMPCELLQPNSDTRYGLALDYEYSVWGSMTCKITGTYVGHQNVSFIVDSEYGRSLPYLSNYIVSSLNQLSMFQSYAEVGGVSPSEGSLQGGTILTINGHYFDETDRPAQVLVGGQKCPILSLSDGQITCQSPVFTPTNMTLFPGGRGLKLEIWNNSRPSTLDEALKYNETWPGYSVRWVDSMSYTWPVEWDYFVARFSGFIVPTETDNYRFYIRGDDRYALYFSKTGSPRDKVKIAYRNYVSWDFFTDYTQRSDILHLEEGKVYYIEVWLQEYGVQAFVDVGFFKGKSSFTNQQTTEGIQEVQIIYTQYNILQEKQVLRFENWTKGNPVNEVQKVTVTSGCYSLGNCDNTYYSLICSSQGTALIPVSASAEEVQRALNALWSIKPDLVQVTKVDISQGSEYTVNFMSRRGDFESLQYVTFGGDVNITVEEVTKGRPSLETFTLEWDTALSTPVAFNASGVEVQKAIEGLVSAQCPDEILRSESNLVKYFRDYENDQTGFTGYSRGTRVPDTEAFCGRFSLMNPQYLFLSSDFQVSGNTYGAIPLQQYRMFCFAYKGYLMNYIGIQFSYQNNINVVISTSSNIDTIFVSGPGIHSWQYTCVDLLSALQRAFPGTNYMLQSLLLYKATPNQDFYVDVVYIGRMATTVNINDVITLRRPPALASRGVFVQEIMVNKIQKPDASQWRYEVTVTPYSCGYDFPLMRIAFAQVGSSQVTQAVSNSSDEGVMYGGPSWTEGVGIQVTRTQRASPPVSGTFDVEFSGKQIKGLPVDVSESDLQYALQGIPEMGQIRVSRWGDCRGYGWRVVWVSNPGDQPLIQINSSCIDGITCRINSYVEQEGGTFKSSILGDFLHVPETKPQVQVYINGIMSKCTGDCGFQWTSAKTPVVSGISPTQGSYAQGTVLTITGSGFASENASVSVGDVQCPILEVNSKSRSQHCELWEIPKVYVSFVKLGFTQNTGGAVFNFTVNMGIFNYSPLAGSVAGGTVLTVSGYGFSNATQVLIGSSACSVIYVSLDEVKCRTPPGTPGNVTVLFKTNEINASASDPFNYDEFLTPSITDLSLQTTNVMGNASLSIMGINFMDDANGSSVFIGDKECKILEWTSDNITCSLPRHPPGIYNIYVQVGNWGYASVSDGVNASIEYVLKVTEVSPLHGSLYGGTKVTVTGSGFSPVTDDIQISMGNITCKVTSASEHHLECITQANESSYTVTNLGSHPDYGVGYAWSPSSLDVYVGDTVQWSWRAPSLVKGLGYRVFSVSTPSSTNYDGTGFISGNAKTASGFFRYRFTVAGIYYYSSGFVDDRNSRFMQGVVTVKPIEAKSVRFYLSVGGIEARRHGTSFAAAQRSRRSVTDCITTTPNCSYDLNPGASGEAFSFLLSDCYSPAITAISPPSGTVYTVISIQGLGFSNTSCANEVTIGGHPCSVINSTTTEIMCSLDPENAMPVGVAQLVSVRVNNLGTAINSVVNEFGRRFVFLPVIDSISPEAGATTGRTRVTILGSGFSGSANSVMVSVASVPCSVVSVNYTAITCDTSPSTARTGAMQVSVLGVSASCHSSCAFEYSSSSVPSVSSVSPDSINGSSTTLTIQGSGFGSQAEDVVVLIGSAPFAASDVADTNITCSIATLLCALCTPSQILQGSLQYMNKTLTSESREILFHSPLVSPFKIACTGERALFSNDTEKCANFDCEIKLYTSETLCMGKSDPEQKDSVDIVDSVLLDFVKLSWKAFERCFGMFIFAGPSGTEITITGSGFGTDLQPISVTIDGVPCNVSAVTDTQILCSVGNHAGGTFLVNLLHGLKGFAASQAFFTYELLLTGVTPNEGSYGGGSILTVQGSGFDPAHSRVLICNKDCEILRQNSTFSSLYCEVPPNNGTGAQQDCPVVVLNSNKAVNISNGFSYKTSLTPVITGVSPRRGGTAGGTRLTITGSNFSSNSSDIKVTIAQSPCDVQSANSTCIICVTNSQPSSQMAKVKVGIGNNGIAKLDNADFFYIDVWSSKYTWGGLSPPEEGTFAVITKGQTILLDTSTPVLKMLLIQGGMLVFDEADIELQAENILITDGGVLQIGTEAAPFQHKAIITLHGHLRSQELPVYGAKTLAVREGILDLHGIPVPVTWTRLAQTAPSGSVTLTLQHNVTWKAGDEIVIASTGHRHSQIENEVKKIASVSADGRTLTLTEPLKYRHLGVSVTLPDGTVFEGRAEVGLLTRNIVVRGSNNIEWNDKIEACEDGFDTGEFATQTCFQGRFGEEVGSDQFGGCIMFHAPRPSENLAIGRIEYVEVFHAGQAFRLGRYPIHWHLMGDMKFKSYVRGCGIHQTYNRAVTIHNTHNLLVEKNVIYDIMGGAFFIEDGIETGNVLQYNLAVFVRQSTSLLNDDVTPAAFWIISSSKTYFGRGGKCQGFHSPASWCFQFSYSISTMVILQQAPFHVSPGNRNHKVVPRSGLLDPLHCTEKAEWSVGYPGAVCDATVSFHRLALNNPSPSSLLAKNIILSNSHGISVVPYLVKRLTHRPGWMALLPNSDTFNWRFEQEDHITDISYSSMFYGFKEADYVIISHNLTQHPDMFRIIDIRNGSSQPLNFTNNKNGDWYFDDNTTTVYYMVSGKKNTRRKRSFSVDPTESDIDVEFAVYRCFFRNCNPGPSEPNSPGQAVLPRPANGYVFWSNESFWNSSAENNFAVPKEGADVVIPAGIWMVLDIDIPSFNRITVYGVLELPDNITAPSAPAANTTSTFRKIILNATYISIQGGRLIAGWSDQPFRGELQIVLRGNHFTPDWPLPNGPNQGAKVLGVFGTLQLHGLPRSVYHTKLAASAGAGSFNILLEESVDWQVDDDLVITTTSYDTWQTEIRKIAMISADGRNVTLNQSLSYTHIAETVNVSETGQQYRLAADVGLLSRNIKIIGQDYPGWYQESFGARVLVGSFSNGVYVYKGNAQIRNVEFYHTGQEGYQDSFDPRYSVAFLDLGQVSANDSYVQGCSFHHGFSPAIGVFGTDGMNIDDNVIYFTVGEGIRVWGSNIKVRRNLVTVAVWPGSYQDREETLNSLWHAAIEVNEGMNIVLQDNIVAGFERVAYHINGEPCPGTFNPVESWHGNEAHGGLYGVYMNKDGLASCSLIQGFTVWKCWDYGIYFQTVMSIQISDVTLVDNGMGVLPIIYTPPSVSHQYSDKTVQIQNSLIVGSSPNFDCSEVLTSSDANVKLSMSHRAPRPLTGGRSGFCWPTFASDHNMAPGKPHAGLMSYNAISGLMTVTNTTLVGFKSVCSKEMNVMFMTNPGNEDLQHPVHVQGLRMVDYMETAKVFIHRPDLSKVNPSDCVDMDCDAKKKALLKDLDGSFLGQVGAVVPQSEYEWNGDKRRGLGDYRIPKIMLTFLNGSRIPVSQVAPYKGIIRDANCTYMSDWQSYKCFGLNYEMLAIESLDADTETRRLSPVAVLGDRYIDLINGPQDHGWCAGYTCQKRVSLFHSIVASNKSFDIYFTSTTPQNLRFMLLNADSTKAVRVAVFYSSPQRLDVYVQNNLVAPTNAKWNADHTDYTLEEPLYPGHYIPQMDSMVYGDNFFESTYKMLNILVRGSTPVEIRTSPLLFISFRLPAMTVDEFYGDKLVQNLALFLKVPPGMIRITKVVREDSRRRKRAAGLSVQVQISQPPSQNLTNSSTTQQQQFDTLKNIADSLAQASISGNLSQSIQFNVSSIGVIPPVPPSTDSSWSQVATQDVSRTDPSVSYVSAVSALVVVVHPIAGGNGELLSQQPAVMAVDSNGNCVSVGVTSFTLTAVLTASTGASISGLNGNTTVLFSSCWANYTDLS
uniref:PKHD1 like 1 n=1 Tax=Lepisosteus oculatus TaxID=7918 RepID=W5M5C1_LEPOC